MITVMVAGGITQADIARAKGIDLKTLRKHYREELDNGASSINTMVLVEHIKLIKKGDSGHSLVGAGAHGIGAAMRATTTASRRSSQRAWWSSLSVLPRPRRCTIDHEPLRADERSGRDALRKNVT